MITGFVLKNGFNILKITQTRPIKSCPGPSRIKKTRLGLQTPGNFTLPRVVMKPRPTTALYKFLC